MHGASRGRYIGHKLLLCLEPKLAFKILRHKNLEDAARSLTWSQSSQSRQLIDLYKSLNNIEHNIKHHDIIQFGIRRNPFDFALDQHFLTTQISILQPAYTLGAGLHCHYHLVLYDFAFWSHSHAHVLSNRHETCPPHWHQANRVKQPVPCKRLWKHGQPMETVGNISLCTLLPQGWGHDHLPGLPIPFEARSKQTQSRKNHINITLRSSNSVRTC